MKKNTLFVATMVVMLLAGACGGKKQEESTTTATTTATTEAAPAKSYLDRLQGSWESGEPGSENWVSLIITGNEAISNISEEYGPDKISIEGDTISYTNETLGGEPRQNKIIKLTENEFVEQALDGSYTNTWRRPKTQ
jgi:ABC-type glycerol-3-phosphate transport system substrate-binding protein